MRIIAGTLKGRRLKPPTWEGLRPTSDKLRETLFNVLAARVLGARVLDGFAGTGALGIEAFSRGASHVTFVESDRRAQALIAENLAHCGVGGGYAIIRGNLARSLEGWLADPATEPFDIVLLDPPYDHASDDMVELLIRSGRLLAKGGVVVVEHARRRAVAASAGSLVLTREITSGDSALALFHERS